MSYDSTNPGWHEEYGQGNYFHDEDSAGYHPDADHEMECNNCMNDDADVDETEYETYDESDGFDDEDEWNEYDSWDEDYYDSMDGDFDSGMASAGHGTDEDYGYYGGEDDDYGYYGEDY